METIPSAWRYAKLRARGGRTNSSERCACLCTRNVWEHIKKRNEIDPEDLVWGYIALRKQRVLLSLPVFHLGEAKRTEIWVDEYLGAMLPRTRGTATTIDFLGYLAQLIAAVGAYYREHGKPPDQILSSFPPEFLYAEPRRRAHYRARKEYVRMPLRIHPDQIVQHVQLLGARYEDLARVPPDTFLDFLLTNIYTLKEKLGRIKDLLGEEYVMKASPRYLISLLSMSVDTVLERLQSLARKKGVSVERLKNMYDPDTLLRKIIMAKR